MAIRIATASVYENTVNNIMQRQNDLSTAQAQISSGKRVNKASDDPAAASRAERALAYSQRIDTQQRISSASQTTMTLSESALGDANDLLQQAHTLMVSAGNPTYGASDRKAIADQLSSIRSQLLGIANRGDGNGGYLFGGQGSQTPPFVDAAGGVQYVGDSGHMTMGGSDNLPLTMDGNSTWLAAPTGNGVFTTGAGTGNSGTATIDAGSLTNASTYYAQTPSSYSVKFSVSGTPAVTTYDVTRTPVSPAGSPGVSVASGQPYTSGQAIQVDGMSLTVKGDPANGDSFTAAPSTNTASVFNVLDDAIAGLNNSNFNSTQAAQSNSNSLTAIDAVMSKVQLGRSNAGNALNLIDGVNTRLDSQKLLATTQRTNAEELDTVSAISSFQAKQTGYSAALQSYAAVQKLSLFNYLNS